MERRINEIINRYIDGDISSVEEVAIISYLSTNPEYFYEIIASMRNRAMDELGIDCDNIIEDVINNSAITSRSEIISSAKDFDSSHRMVNFYSTPTRKSVQPTTTRKAVTTLLSYFKKLFSKK